MTPPGTIDPQKMYVTPRTPQPIYVHSGPGEQFAVWSPAALGDLLEVIEDPTQASAKIGQSGAWIQVRDKQGNSGWVDAASVDQAYAGAATPAAAPVPAGTPPAASGSPQPPSPTPTAPPTPVQPPVQPRPPMPQPAPSGPLYVHTTLSNGQWIRSGPDLQQPTVADTTTNDRLIAIGDPAATLANLGRYPQWIQVQTPSGVVGWAAAWYLERFPEFVVCPVGHALVGLHGPTETWADRWDNQAFQIIGQARIEAVKMLASNTLAAQPDMLTNIISQLRTMNVKFILVRLFAKFDTPRSPQDFVSEVSPDAIALYNRGVRYFEVHNEPNLNIPPNNTEGMFVSWMNGTQFGDFFLQSVALFRQNMPDAQFGFPGLSPAPEMPKQIYNAGTFLTEAANAVQSADFLCMHTYWGGDGSSYLDSINAVKAFCQKYPSKPVFVTEFANTSTAVGKDVKGREYVLFYKEASKLPSNLGALFSYAMVSAGNDPEQMWAGSPIPQLVGSRSAS